MPTPESNNFFYLIKKTGMDRTAQQCTSACSSLAYTCYATLRDTGNPNKGYFLQTTDPRSVVVAYGAIRGMAAAPI